jgi:DNA-binding NtrC family response regulator
MKVASRFLDLAIISLTGVAAATTGAHGLDLALAGCMSGLFAIPCATFPPLIFIDDDHTFRLAFAALLLDDGHAVRDFGLPAALPPFDAWPNGSMLVTDFEMPGQNGLQLADAFRRTHPSSAALLVSGHTAPALAAALAVRPWLRFASKAIEYDPLHAILHEHAGAWHGRA